MDPPPNLDGANAGGNDSPSTNTAPTAPTTPPAATKHQTNFIPNGHIDYKTPMKRHTEKQNEIYVGDQARRKTTGHSFTQLTQPEPNEYARERHLADEIPNATLASSAAATPSDAKFLRGDEVSRRYLIPVQAPRVRSPRKPSGALQDRPSHRPSSGNFDHGHGREKQWERSVVEGLKRQNQELMEALVRAGKTHATEKKRFHEILLGLDEALSSLPVRLEKIRARNQRNLTVINTSRFCRENPAEPSLCDSTTSDRSSASRDSRLYLSARMKSLLRRMEHLNDLVRTMKKDESSAIELLVDGELYAISLLKREIRSTKKLMEDDGTESEPVTSCEGSYRQEPGSADSSSKAKNSFSNELNKASNFKIFENHMILQEEALNLLTRKIKETEEALVREVEAKEGLRREKEAMAKEIFRLKSTGEESKGGEKSEKMDKLKAEAEATGNRPYRLIKELRAKLEEKEKCLIGWKSKCSRLEAAAANKTVLIEKERKRNAELEAAVKNLKWQNKSTSSHLNGLQLLNEQLRGQVDILSQRVEMLAGERLEPDPNSGGSKKIGDHIADLSEIILLQEAKVKRMEKKAEDKVKKLQELNAHYERQLEETRCRLGKCQKKNEEFSRAFKELLLTMLSLATEKELSRSTGHPSHKRIREILNITPSDLQLLYGVYVKSTNEKEAEKLHGEFEAIVDGEEGDDGFSERLSTWFFGLLREKLLAETGSECGRTETCPTAPTAVVSFSEAAARFD